MCCTFAECTVPHRADTSNRSAWQEYRERQHEWSILHGARDQPTGIVILNGAKEQPTETVILSGAKDQLTGIVILSEAKEQPTETVILSEAKELDFCIYAMFHSQLAPSSTPVV